MKALLLAVCLTALCQAQEIRPIQLTSRQKITSAIDSTTPYQAPVKCDAEGNLYLRPWASDDVPFLLKIGPDGKQVGKITFSPPPGVNGTIRRIVDFTLDNFGSLYAYVYVHGPANSVSEYLLTYKSDGQFSGAMKVTTPEDFEVTQFERFTSGELLLNGHVMNGGDAKAAIIGQNGQVSAWVTSRSFKKEANGKLSKNDAIASSVAYTVSADDGNVWFMRPMINPVIFAVSPAGQIVHQFTVEKPSGYEQINLAVGKGRIMMDFQPQSAKDNSTDPELYRIYDTVTGDLLYEYAADATSWGLFGCYVSPSEFVTLQADEKTNHFNIIRATP